MVKKIVSVVLVIIIVIWAGLFVSEFLNVQKGKDPRLCISKKTVEYENNRKTEICTGLGYKVFKYYDEKGITIEFGHFFKQDKNAK